MKVKSALKTLTLLVSSIVLSLALFGCEKNTVQPSASNQSTANSPPPAASVSEPAASPQTPVDPAVARGLSLYNAQCKVCHGTNGSGGSGSRLIGKTPSATYIQANMPRNKPSSLSNEQVSDLVAYITSLK